MNLNKRLNKIEERLSPKELPTAWIAEIKDCGKVELSHIDHGTIHLPDTKALQYWEQEHNPNGLPVIKIEYV